MGKDKSDKKRKSVDAASAEAPDGETVAAPAAAAAPEELSYDEKKKYCSIIAKPLADEKLCKKVLKLAKKAAKRKQIRRGVKEVVKALRKNAKG